MSSFLGHLCADLDEMNTTSAFIGCPSTKGPWAGLGPG